MSHCGVACGQSQFSSRVQGVDNVPAVKHPVMGGACRRNPQHFGVCTQVRGFSAQVIHRFVHRKPVSKSPAGLAGSSGSGCWCWRDTRLAAREDLGAFVLGWRKELEPVTGRPSPAVARPAGRHLPGSPATACPKQTACRCGRASRVYATAGHEHLASPIASTVMGWYAPAGEGPACRVVPVLMRPGRGSVRVRRRSVGAV